MGALYIASLALLDYYAVQLLYYGYHRFVHNPRSGILYKMHFIQHHRTQFPLSKLRTDEYPKLFDFAKTKGELVFGIPSMMALVATYFLFSRTHFCIFTCTVVGSALVGEFAHSSFHLNSTATSHPESLWLFKKLCKTTMFLSLQRLHDIHHARPNTNFGVVDFSIDKLFGTHATTCPKHLDVARSTHVDADMYKSLESLESIESLGSE